MDLAYWLYMNEAEKTGLLGGDHEEDESFYNEGDNEYDSDDDEYDW